MPPFLTKRNIRTQAAVFALLIVCAGLGAQGVPQARAQQNTVDPVFGGAGLGLTGTNGLILQPDGKLLVVGGLDGIDRLNADGTVDTGFYASVHGGITAFALQGNGQIIVGGAFDQIDGVMRVGVARLNADGTLDPAFTDAASAVAGSGSSIVTPQSDGKVLVAGDNTGSNGQTQEFFVRLNADGTLDTAFPSFNLVLFAVKLQADGRIIIGGAFSQINGQTYPSVARLNVDGTLDGTFQPPATLASQSVDTVDVQPDGKILLSGVFDPSGGAETALIRLNADGSVDTGFHYAGDMSPYLTALATDGRILLSFYNDPAGSSVVRLLADGSADPTFQATANDRVEALATSADGTVYIGGEFNEVNGTDGASLVRLQSNGNLDASYRIDANSGPNSQVDCLALQTDGKILIGGEFTSVNGNTRRGVARLKTDGSPDATFSANIASSTGGFPAVYADAVSSDGKILLAGYFDQVNDSAAVAVARLNSDGSLDASFKADSTVSVAYTMVLQADGKILVSCEEASSGDADPVQAVVRLNTNGTLDTGFTAFLPGSGNVSSVVVQADGKILVGGDMLTAEGQDLVRLNADGSLDAGFNAASLTGDPQAVNCLATTPNGKILVGGNGGTNSAAPGGLARLNADGSADTGFNARVVGYVNAVLTQQDGTIVIGGDFAQVDGQARQGLAHLSDSGGLSPFVPVEAGVDPNGYVTGFLQQTDGKVLLCGYFTTVNGVRRNFVARLQPNGTPDFFNWGVPVGGGFYYEQFPDGTPFGYYNLAGDGYAFPYFFHADLGLEYFFDAGDGKGGAYLFDFASGGFFYTSPVFPWPYLYDFTLNTVLYYYPDPSNPGHYNTDGYRFFYRFDTGQVIVK